MVKYNFIESDKNVSSQEKDDARDSPGKLINGI